jgi:two-component system, OmpR family, sensor histidine kinase MprB
VSFRARLAFAVAAAVALVVVAASPVVYAIVRSELRGQVDDALRARAHSVANSQHLGIGRSPFTGKPVLQGIPGELFEGGKNYVQLYQEGTGNTYRPEFQSVLLPVNDAVREVAAGTRRTYITDTEVQGAHVRMYALHGTDEEGRGYALQVIRPVGEVDSALGRIRTLLLVVDAVGILVAALLGLLVARTALGPVRRLTQTAEHVTETRDLNSRIDVHGRDELSRLAATFNTMLAALEESARAQRQLVTDASHELRTPLTSLRTNMEVLIKHEDLEQSRRRQLQAHVVEQLDELTALVAELVELARGEQPAEEPEEVQLDELVRSVVGRAQRDHPQVRYEATLEPSVINGVPFRIERAVSNLLDNAAKWSPPEGKVEVGVRDGEVIVRDRGPGIADEDLPFVFDRFYRAPSARGMPGSGLGLAIVKQVAESQGGDVVVERPPDGGTRMRLRLTATAGPDEPSRPAAASPMIR